MDAPRSEQIERYDVLERPAPPDLQALVDIAAQICEVPTAAINLITHGEQHQIATAGFAPEVCARDDSMCAAVLTETAPVIVEDASRDDRFRLNPFVTGDIGEVRFYASAPLVTPAGVTIGRLCVFDSVTRVLDTTQADTLELLARRVVDVLELRLRTRQLEESLLELTHTRDELHRSNEQLTHFASQVSHDLMNPLAGIIASAECLATEQAVRDDPVLEAQVRNVFDSGRRMEAMAVEILRHAGLGARLDKRTVDLDRLLREVRLDLADLLDRTRTTLEVGPLGEVEGDPRQLYSVFLNLLSNAAKFTRPGVPPRVSVRRAVGEGVRLEVVDHGPGIRPERRREVFRLFARADHRVPGSGIGLATVHRIVTAHGGVVTLAETPGGGTTVVLDLPASINR